MALSEAAAVSPAANDESDREVVVTRVFDAPRQLVFDVWTDPRHVGTWWGPNGFTTTTHAIDVRPGGAWRFIMHGPDGTDYDNVIFYDEIARPERLVYRHGEDENAPVAFNVTVTFAEESGKTRVTIRSLFPTAEALRFVAEKYGAIEGAHQHIDRLGEYVSKLHVDLTFVRVFEAPRELVFRTWTDPKQIGQWWGPHYFTNNVRNFEPRPGGAFEIDMIGPDGTVYPGGGTFQELVEPERIVFTSTALDENGEVVIEDRNVVTFEDEGGKTRMTVNARVLRAYGVGLQYIAGMEEGWSQSLARLGVAVDPNTFVTSRTFDAPRDLVFRAWTEKEHLMQWFSPVGFKVIACTNDLRPGGAMHYGLRSEQGEMWGRWIWREITPPRQLSFVSSFSDAEGGLARAPFFDGGWPLETLSTVIFGEHNGRTMVTMYGAPINATDAERATFLGNHASMQGGWGGTLDQLEAYLAEVTK
jgi:uncharacterized protein YndB with AHSA1/START domain